MFPKLYDALPDQIPSPQAITGSSGDLSGNPVGEIVPLQVKQGRVERPAPGQTPFKEHRHNLPVPVLVEPTKHQVANVVKVHEGEAREGTMQDWSLKHSHSRGGQTSLSGGVERRHAQGEGSYGTDPLGREAQLVAEREHAKKAFEASGSIAPSAQTPVSGDMTKQTERQAVSPAQSTSRKDKRIAKKLRRKAARDADQDNYQRKWYP